MPSPSRRGLSRVEAAGYVGVSPGTFDRLVVEGKMPVAKRVYARRIWDRRALDMAFDALDCEEIEGNEWDKV